ncbi:MAG: glycosyltransferase family 2 protein [Firmicutes bacterium]|nr:glycosyltransferase family 2 protein [Bacillota bacterium]
MNNRRAVKPAKRHSSTESGVAAVPSAGLSNDPLGVAVQSQPKRHRHHGHGCAAPLVSVVVPCRNEERHIRKCVSSILGNGYPGDIEVLVVDGLSSDRTRDVLSDMRRYNPEIRVLDNPSRTTPQALNIGIREAKGEIILIIGAHCWLGTGYIEKVVQHLLSRDNVGCAGGRTVAVAETGYLRRLISKVLSSPFGVGNSLYRLSDVEQSVREVDTVAYAAYPRRVFDEVGLFDERLIRDQDVELNSRIRRAGYKILFEPEAVIYYSPRDSLTALWKQNYGNGLWNIKTWRMIPGSLSLRHFVPFFFVAGLLILGLAAPFLREARLLLAGTVTLYVLADMTESIRIACRDRDLSLLGASIVFPVLHVSYGTGSVVSFLSELIRAFSRKKAEA